MLQAKLVAKIETPTTHKKSDGEPRAAIGTGYPIQDGLVLTARHVLYHKNRDESLVRKISWRREDEENPYLESEFNDDDIIFEDTTFDIALVRCQTPKVNFKKPILYPDVQEPRNTWESMGYPTVGKDAKTGVRIKTPTGGGILTTDSDYYIQQLRIDVDASEIERWRGLSGAPVFNKDTGQLIAIITHTPDKFRDKSGKLSDKYKNIILATSIPYLLTEGQMS